MRPDTKRTSRLSDFQQERHKTRTLYTLCGADPDRHFSPHAWKVEMALHHKGLEFDAVPTPFTRIPQIEDGATKTVPLLVDGDRTVVDSFAIAEYLEDAYPDAPSLFGGPGGKAAARFIERWSLANVQAPMMPAIISDLYAKLSDEDQAYFRKSREERLGATLEEVVTGREAEIAAFAGKCTPLRNMLKFQPFIGGSEPLFSDYIVFGALQWASLTGNTGLLDPNDPVSNWFERCLEIVEKG